MSLNECNEKCGIGAGIAPESVDIVPIVINIGMELIHRGQEEGGLSAQSGGNQPVVYRDSKRFDVMVAEKDFATNHNLVGNIALAHTRYRTTGPVKQCYAQPMDIIEGQRRIDLVTNGNVANFKDLYRELKAQGATFDTENQYDEEGRLASPSDSEVLFRKIARAEGNSWAERIANGVKDVEGSYSIVAATDYGELIALRDPWGIRPLSFGRINGYFVVASETVALDKINAKEITEINKGEMWVFKNDGKPERIIYSGNQKRSYCDFEDYYFSHPASIRNGIEIAEIRKACGRQLAIEEITKNRIPKGIEQVIYAPDTSRSGSGPFGFKLGLPVEEKIFKERYGERGVRSFIGSSDILRKGIIDAKFVYSTTLKGKNIYVLDDTGVRLTTAKLIFRKLKELGVAEIHARFLAPKFVRPCFLGTNINRREELGAVEKRGGNWYIKSDAQIASELGVESVAFLSMEGRRAVRESFGERVDDFCGYCHGDCGPDMNFVKYDPDLVKERYNIA